MRSMLISVLTFLGFALGAVVLLCLFIYLRQERLIFHPRANDPALREHWRWHRVEIPSGKHVLEGWWADAGAPEWYPLLRRVLSGGAMIICLLIPLATVLRRF